MKRGIYAIRDQKANDNIGGLQVFPSDAVAVRFFGDVLADQSKGNVLAQHPEDFVLVKLGELGSDGLIDSTDFVAVITGTQWRNAQAPQEPQLSLMGGDK